MLYLSYDYLSTEKPADIQKGKSVAIRPFNRPEDFQQRDYIFELKFYLL